MSTSLDTLPDGRFRRTTAEPAEDIFEYEFTDQEHGKALITQIVVYATRRAVLLGRCLPWLYSYLDGHDRCSVRVTCAGLIEIRAEGTKQSILITIGENPKVQFTDTGRVAVTFDLLKPDLLSDPVPHLTRFVREAIERDGGTLVLEPPVVTAKPHLHVVPSAEA